jgi:hypothetical protein
MESGRLTSVIARHDLFSPFNNAGRTLFFNSSDPKWRMGPMEMAKPPIRP